MADIGCDRPGGVLLDAENQTENTPVQPKEKGETSMLVKIGHKAPDFAAPAYFNGEFSTVKLSDQLGKWVVLCFYPGDFTFVCATEISAIAEKNDVFEKMGVQVLSMSTDSPFVHKVWVDNELSKITSKGTIPFPMLSDGGGKIGEAYGVYEPEGGVDVRGRFLIDPDGIVVGYEILTPPVGRNVSETIRQLQAFQYVRENPSQVTVSGWTPGKTVLTPGPALVGNVWKEFKVETAFE